MRCGKGKRLEEVGLEEGQKRIERGQRQAGQGRGKRAKRAKKAKRKEGVKEVVE